MTAHDRLADDDDPAAEVPLRHVSLSCNEDACPASLGWEVRSPSLEDALPGLVEFARSQGWTADAGDEPDYCPDHSPTLLGTPGTGEG